MSNTENICVECGLCCDGTLFKKANLLENEQVNSSYSLQILNTDDGKRGFKLACCYLDGKVCTIYENRPYKVCGDFECTVLVSLKSGNTTFKEAKEMIEDTIVLKNRIERYLSNNFPEIQTPSLQWKLIHFEAIVSAIDDQKEFRRKHGELFLLLAAFTMKIERNFWKQKN